MVVDRQLLGKAALFFFFALRIAGDRGSRLSFLRLLSCVGGGQGAGGLSFRALCLVVAAGVLSVGAAASGPCFAGGGTVVHGGGYWGDCVGGVRTVCAALSSNLYGLSSGLTGSDDAVFLLSPRAVPACGLAEARAWRPLCWWRRICGGRWTHGEPRRFTIRHGEHGSAPPLCGRSQSDAWTVGGGVGGAWMGCAAQSFCSGLKGFSNSALLVCPYLPRVLATAAPGGRAGGDGGTGGVTESPCRA